MRGLLTFISLFAVAIIAADRSGLVDSLNQIAVTSKEHKLKALKLLKENNELKKKVKEVEYQVQTLQAKNNYLEIKMSQGERSVASIPKLDLKKDKVSFDVFNWSEDKLLAIGLKAFRHAQYDKSAQYLNELLDKYPKSKLITPKILYMAGVASYKSQQHYDQAIDILKRVVANYPASKYFRSAKLWLALSHLHQGNKENFFNTVEEFRLKYRNTEEWKILSRYYEELAYRYQD